MDLESAIANSLSLLQRSTISMVGSNDSDGYPHIKGMYKIEAEGLKTIWFSTNTSSSRVSQFTLNPKASVYHFDSERVEGLLLIGQIEIMSDAKTKNRFWKNGWEVYYPLGADDPDYCMLKFTAHRGNYYHRLKNISFGL
ncbi:pyridoxamine 5'-phosphate oxidase family protein [Paenibacillus sp. GCM10027626]|uniref:pyridoxamine 5'-phosphate oxidase family protein n=1 Tax=Paenibacillus sp. GCM10027626 TaxID=3273411 RepID=UPI003627C858